MEEIKQCTLALVNAVKESEAYQNFEKAKQELAEKPELRAKVMAFRKRNYEMQNLEEGKDLYVEMERLEEEYHEVRKNPVIRNYLQSELEMCRIMQRINLSLVQAVDLDIADFQDIIKW